MHYTFVADSFYTFTLSSEARVYTENGRFAFLSGEPPFGAYRRNVR